jgi:hypothetical protein
MTRHVLCVDERPYCVWDNGITNFNAEYLNSINPKFYEFIAHQNYNIIIDKDANKESKQFAALLLRNYYTQALETLFALIFATLQSPKCISGWMLNYRNVDLYSLVEKVNKNISIKIRFKINEKFNWERIVKIIFSYLDDNSEAKPIIVENFSGLLNSFVTDFLNENLRNEYNSVKHGFRAQSGGFTLEIQPPEKSNINIPKSELKNLLHSEYGSAFYTEEKIPERKNQYCINYHALNWNPENIYHGIYFISLLINNIITFLKLYNELQIEGIEYLVELPNRLFNYPWKNIAGSGAFKLGGEVDLDTIPKITDEQIFSIYHNTYIEN